MATCGARPAPHRPCRSSQCWQRSTRVYAASGQPTSKAGGGTGGSGAAAERIQLGRSDLWVSKCCLGTMTWGMQNSEEEAHAQLNCAVDEFGLNFIDTAEIYPVPPAAETQGRTESYIGSWLRGGGGPHPQRRREDIVLATKVSGFGRQGWLRERGATPRVDAANIEEALNKSLARLGTDYVDLLQVHWPDRYVPLFGAAPYNAANERDGDVPFEEQLEGLQRMVAAGKVRHVGVSNETSYGVMRFVAAAEASQGRLPRICSIQNNYSLLMRGGYEGDLAEVCAPRQCGVSLLAYSPLAGGALTGKYILGGAGVDTSKARLNLFQGYMARYQQSLAKEAVSQYAEVARKHGLTPTQLALAWCASRWFVASTIIGATSLEQLRDNVEAFDVQLSDECLADIDVVYRRYRDPAFN